MSSFQLDGVDFRFNSTVLRISANGRICCGTSESMLPCWLPGDDPRFERELSGVWNKCDEFVVDRGHPLFNRELVLQRDAVHVAFERDRTEISKAKARQPRRSGYRALIAQDQSVAING